MSGFEGGFDPDESRGSDTHCRAQRVQVAHVDGDELEACADIGFVDQRPDAEIHVVWHDDAIALAGVRLEHRRDGGHARRKGNSGAPAFEGGHRRFERVPRRIGVPDVFVSRGVAAVRRAFEGRACVEGKGDCPRRRIDAATDMDCLGFEVHSGDPQPDFRRGYGRPG